MSLLDKVIEELERLDYSIEILDGIEGVSTYGRILIQRLNHDCEYSICFMDKIINITGELPHLNEMLGTSWGCPEIDNTLSRSNRLVAKMDEIIRMWGI